MFPKPLSYALTLVASELEEPEFAKELLSLFLLTHGLHGTGIGT